MKNAVPSLIFEYRDEGEEREIGRNELLSALSTGEKRALYLLNVIFEIQSFIKNNEDKILILDDIADSFDYRNKYAIVEYIKSIVETEKFIVIILTHNFDFFRTVQSRLTIKRPNNCLMAVKSTDSVSLQPASYLNPFKHWRKRLSSWNQNIDDKKILIASIPMVRNLAEYMGNDSDFILLTSILHQKTDTNTITVDSIVPSFKRILGITIPGSEEKITNIIFNLADTLVSPDESINLENKIILSIAIRLYAENLVIQKINDVTVTDNIAKNQTRMLFKYIQDNYPDDKAILSLLEKVVLMTPETIHLNSFMYEPILDLSDCHLQSLYKELKKIASDVNLESA